MVGVLGIFSSKPSIWVLSSISEELRVGVLHFLRSAEFLVDDADVRFLGTKCASD